MAIGTANAGSRRRERGRSNAQAVRRSACVKAVRRGGLRALKYTRGEGTCAPTMLSAHAHEVSGRHKSLRIGEGMRREGGEREMVGKRIRDAEWCSVSASCP
jgi:hypothetical protein